MWLEASGTMATSRAKVAAMLNLQRLIAIEVSISMQDVRTFGRRVLHVRPGRSHSIKLRLTEAHVTLKLALRTFEAETTNVEPLPGSWCSFCCSTSNIDERSRFAGPHAGAATTVISADNLEYSIQSENRHQSNNSFSN